MNFMKLFADGGVYFSTWIIWDQHLLKQRLYDDMEVNSQQNRIDLIQLL